MSQVKLLPLWELEKKEIVTFWGLASCKKNYVAVGV